MQYGVMIKKKAAKKLENLPYDVKQLFFLLVEGNERFGSDSKILAELFSLGGNRYHCHLTYRYVACWTWNKGTIEIEVYYVGSREKAPY